MADVDRREEGGRGVLLLSSVARLQLLAGLYLLLSGVAFIIYALDKVAAGRGWRRVPETALHLLALAGGWPGALAARAVFRHKTRKQPFRALFWGTVAVNLTALVWFCCRAV